MPSPKNLGFTTRAIHAGEEPDPTTGAHGVPIYQNSTFALGTMERFQEFWDSVPNAWGYTRDGNPTVDHLERKVADLEGAKACVAAASGMGAISATLLTVWRQRRPYRYGEPDLQHRQQAGERDLPQYGLTFSRVDITDLDAVEAAITPQNHRDLYRGLFQSGADRGRCAGTGQDRATEHGLQLHHRQHLLSPALYRPLEDGADLVIHSATKYLAGHGEVLGGVVSGSNEAIAPIRTKALRLGSTLQPLCRLADHDRHAHAAVAHGAAFAQCPRGGRISSAHPAVASWHYPGAGRSRYATATRLLGENGALGGMLTISLNGGADRSRRSSNR